jgi:hypothetical protein
MLQGLDLSNIWKFTIQKKESASDTGQRCVRFGLGYSARSLVGPANAGSVSISQYLLSAPILTVPIPNLLANVAEKALESLSSPPPLGGNERCTLSFR